MRSIVFKTWLGVAMLTGVGLSAAWGQETLLLDDVKIPLLAHEELVEEIRFVNLGTIEVRDTALQERVIEQLAA